MIPSLSAAKGRGSRLIRSVQVPVPKEQLKPHHDGNRSLVSFSSARTSTCSSSKPSCSFSFLTRATVCSSSTGNDSTRRQQQRQHQLTKSRRISTRGAPTDSGSLLLHQHQRYNASKDGKSIRYYSASTTTSENAADATTTAGDGSATRTTTTSNIELQYQDCQPSCSQPLGVPLPPLDEHACSVSLPTWSSVVGYEEGCTVTTEALQCGYPRFVYHPYVIQLMDYVLKRTLRESSSTTSAAPTTEAQDCVVLPNLGAALRCQAFLEVAVLGSSSFPDNCLIHDDYYNTAGADPSTKNIGTNIGNSRTSAAAAGDDPILPSSSPVSIQRVLPHDDSNNRDNTTRNGSACDDVYAVLFPAQTVWGTTAKSYWQHGGEVVSSRLAADCLDLLQIPRNFDQEAQEDKLSVSIISPNSSHETSSAAAMVSNAGDADSATPHRQLENYIATWTNIVHDEQNRHIFLTPSGMSTLYVALRSARRYQMQTYGNGGGTSIVFGFPYLDTLKLCSRPELCPEGVEFFGHGDKNDLEQLEQYLNNIASSPQQQRVGVLFTEVPSNPLLKCPDLVKLRQLCDDHDIVLVVDDTISNFCNVDLIHNVGVQADVICSSLTKLVSGRGNCMAGSVVANPHTKLGRAVAADLQQHHSSSRQLYVRDAACMVVNATDFPCRNDRINKTTLRLADWLQSHPDVHTVYFPKFCDENGTANTDSNGDGGIPAPCNYTPLLSNQYGYGGLLSIVLDSHVCQRSFFDQLDVCKGPSLGTNFTLACPYTLLAHYHELDFAMTYNVPPNLIRVAVGLEDYEDLQEKFQQAFSAARLYPKVVVASPTLANTNGSNSE